MLTLSEQWAAKRDAFRTTLAANALRVDGWQECGWTDFYCWEKRVPQIGRVYLLGADGNTEGKDEFNYSHTIVESYSYDAAEDCIGGRIAVLAVASLPTALVAVRRAIAHHQNNEV